jgi:aspartyl-tRNA synthetase
MKKIYIKNLREYFNQEITFGAFVDNIRDLQYVQFVILRDGTGKVQMTVEKNEENKELNAIVSSLTLESTVNVKCMVMENEKVKLNGMELIPSSIEITSKSLSEYPIDIRDKSKSERENRLDNRFLDLRKEENALIFRVQTTLESAMREYWTNNEYIEIHSPKISGASAEGGAEVFKLDYFGQKASLSQSPQLYKQMAMAAGFNKVFEIGQVFRAENSHTSYHATEITMIDSEISWIDSVQDVMDEQEAWIKYAFNKVKEKHGEEIKKVYNVEIGDVNIKFPRITFKEAKEILKNKYNYEALNKDDFERKEEELICKYAKEVYGSDFIFVYNYPYATRPFYTMKEDETYSKSFDLLYKGIEMSSGAQREHRADVLEAQIIEKGINPESMRFYIDFFKYGCPPHGGFGVGLARILMQMLEIDNIREVTFVYRGPTRLNP